MHDPVADLVKRGRSLPTEERERLVDQLLESLNEPAAAELDAAWESEIQRRLDAYDRAEVQAVDAEEVFAKARRLAQ
jgi:putative addiction module component (TIGR02574 family)